MEGRLSHWPRLKSPMTICSLSCEKPKWTMSDSYQPTTSVPLPDYQPGYNFPIAQLHVSSTFSTSPNDEDLNREPPHNDERVRYNDREDDDFDYLYFATFLGKRDIHIIPLSELVSPGTGRSLDESIMSGIGNDNDTIGVGGSMQVFLSTWKSNLVAVKLPRTHQRPVRRYSRV